MTLYEVVVPIIRLRHRKAKVKVTLSAIVRTRLQAGVPGEISVSVAADGNLTSPLLISCDVPEVGSAVVENLGPTPRTVPVRFTPSAPGRQSLIFHAVLGGEKVAEQRVEVEVARAAVEQDVARAKLTKLFGED
jgi:hypothetical protein